MLERPRRRHPGPPAPPSRPLIPGLRARLRWQKKSVFDEYALRRLILRDYLAVERTRLANERTALSYFRTTLTLTAGAVTILQFTDNPEARVTGWGLLALGALLLVFALFRFLSVRRRVAGYARLHQPRGPAAPPRGDGG
jgi:putative membrane protein